MASFDYDVVIIGSGFGGSVAALRAAEKGYRVGVMESGRRWKDEDIPKTQWDLPHFLWFPAAELYGIQRIEYLDDVLVLSGAGVGGGSHVYANTLYVPPKQFFDAPEWAGITDWADELAPYLDQATPDARRRPLPVHADRRRPGPCSRSRPRWAEGRRSTRPRSASTSARPGVEADDPYFGGVGPRRTGCISCGNCNIGCGHNAKNKLTTNYLYLAEKLGAEVHELHEVYDLVPLDGGGFEVRTAPSRLGAARGAPPPPHLHRRAGHRRRPRLRLGQAPAPHAAQGPPDGPVEPARAASADELRAASRGHADPRGVGARSGEDPHHAGVGVDHLRRLAGPGDEHRADLLGGRQRPVRVPGHLPPARRAEAPDRVLAQGAGRAPGPRCSASTTRATGPSGPSIMLCSQTTDTSIELYWHDGLLRSRHGSGTPPRCTSRSIEDFVDRVAKKMDSGEGALLFEAINRNASAHFVGGIPIGESSESGAVDPYLRLFGQPGLHVMDGSVMPANPGREPVADDHRPGRARDVAVAEQGRRRTPGRRWARATSASTRSCRTVPSCPPALRASCGSTRRRPTSSPHTLLTRTEGEDR